MAESQVIISPTTITVRGANGTELSYRPTQLPEAFLSWQSEARLAMFEAMSAGGADAIRFQPAHLPILGTIGDAAFPINLASRGVGLLPRKEKLEEVTERFGKARTAADQQDWRASLPDRVRAAQSFYEDDDNFDTVVLGGLEIFEGRTGENLSAHPLAALLYTGAAPRFVSYQINTVAERVGPDDPHYHFLLAARELFAWDSFHIPQHAYPYGYLFHVVEVVEKTPFPRDGKQHAARSHASTHDH